MRIVVPDRDIQGVAADEGVEFTWVKEGVEKGTIVILKNRVRERTKPVGIGKGLRTKINVNLGTSPDRIDFDLEIKKLELSIELGADTVMDLSTGGEIRDLRLEILKRSKIISKPE
jgi:phosphomethylpyrimidine synthase